MDKNYTRISSNVLRLIVVGILFSTFLVEVGILTADFQDQDSPGIEVPRLLGNGYIVSRKNQKLFLDKSKSESSDSSEYAGFGSGLKFSIRQSNETHTWIPDPTNQTDGYYISNDSGYLELNSSRGQSYQHYYNSSSNTYTFKSNELVNRTGIIEGTDWVTEEEYPNRFIIRLTNGSLYFFDTVSQINSFYASIDNSTVWGVGYESFRGVLALYLNFQDLDWGHGQLLYYPRLGNGQLPAFNQPLYAIYYHLFSKVGSTWYDKILNDRALYDTPAKNPRNTLHFYNESDTVGFYYTTYGININGFTWDFEHGFKWNTSDSLFHMIDEFRCRDRDFDDIGYGYEITTSPQAEGTSYEVDRFLLQNETYSIEVNVSQAWQAGTYLEDFYSSVCLVSQNNESMVFSFDDMEQAGFTQKYLELHDQTFPNGLDRKVLLAGMYGYGSYSNGTIIEIDPDITDVETTDNYDLYQYGSPFPNTWSTSSTQITAGSYTGESYYDAFICWDTGIELELSGTSAVAIEVYVVSETMESNEGWTGKVYNIGGNADSNTAKENSLSDSAGTSATESGILINPATGAYRTMDTTKSEVLTDYWATNRDSDEEYISFTFVGYLVDYNTNDRISVYDAQSGSNEPRLSFTYAVANSAPDAPALNTDSGDTYAGKSHTIKTNHTDSNGATDISFMFIQYYYSGYNITLACPNSTTSGSVTVILGSGYVVGTPTYSHTTTGITNGHIVTWTITLDWDFVDDTAYTVYGRTNDSVDEWCSWTSLDTNNLFENDLEVVSATYTYPTANEYGGSSGTLEDSDYFKTGYTLTISGTVEYEGSSQTYDDAYGTASVQFWWDNDDDGTLEDLGDSYDDDTITSGSYSISFTQPSGSGASYTTNANMDLTIQTIDSGGSDVTGATIDRDLYKDDAAPSCSGFTPDADTDSGGDGYAPNTNYEDDSTLDGTLTGDSDTGVGIHQYYIKYDGGSYGSAGETADDVSCTITTGSNDIHYKITDLVGNEGTGDTGVDIFYGTTDPSSFDVDIGGALGYPTDNVYIADYTDITSGTVYGVTVGSPQDWSITVDCDGSADWGSGGAWKVAFKNWDTGYTEDSSAPYEKTDYNFGDGDTPTYIYVEIINNCGEMLQLTLTMDADNTYPTYSITGEAETSAYLYKEYSGVYAGYYGSGMGASLEDYIISGTASDAESGVNSLVDDTSFGNNPSCVGTTSWSFTYSIDSDDDGNIVITFYCYDNVGNYNVGEPEVFYFYEDNTNPSIAVTGESESSDYLYSGYGTTIQGVYGSQMGSTQAYTVSGTGSDGESGLGSLVDDTSFGDNPTYSGSLSSWSFVYDIDASDNGDVPITYTMTDNVGNTNTATYDFYEDNTAPSGISILLTADTNTGTGYTPQTGYYDDDSVDVSVSGSPADGLAGIPTNCYSFQIDSDGWSSYQSETTYGFTSVSDGSHDCYVKLRDNVYNEYTPASVGVEVDTDDPASFTETRARTTGIDDGYYAYYYGATTTIYTNIGSDDYFTITINNDGSINNSGYWKVVWDISSLFETVEHDTDALPESKDFSMNAGESGSNFEIRIVNNAGNYQVIQYTNQWDTIAPYGDMNLFQDYNTGVGYTPLAGYYDDDSVDVQYDDYGDAISFLPTNFCSFGIDEQGSWQSTNYYNFTSVSDGSYTVYFRLRDIVGNSREEDTSLVVDTDDPADFTLTESRHTGIDNGFYAYISGSTIYFNSAQDDYFSLYLNNNGNWGNSGRQRVYIDLNSVFISVETYYNLLPYSKDFPYQSDSSGSFVLRYVNCAGNYQEISYTATEDTTAPTYSSFALDQDSQRKVDNWYHTTAFTTTLTSPADSSSGLASDYVQYCLNSVWGGGSDTWEATNNKGFTGIDQTNNTFDMKLRDRVGNIKDDFAGEWCYVDAIAPDLQWLTLNETYAPNWYDQLVSSTAQASINWVENFSYSVEASCGLSHTDDTSPSGGNSLINFTITGAEDGSYAVSITIYDKAGNSDTTLLGSEAPIQLESGMSLEAHLIEYWFFYYRSDGRSLDWKEFNTTYVLDEEHANYTEVLFLGVGIGKCRFNDTSSIRIITRDYFQEVIYNSSFALPDTSVVNIQLNVHTFKVASNYDGIVNMTVERTSGQGSYDEQIMPYEIFRWDLYATSYNITGLVHATGSFVKDDQGNTLNDFQINLTSSDVAIFIEIVNTGLCSITLVDQNSKFLEPRQFKIYAGGTRIYSDSFNWVDITTSKNITITDIFDNQLYQDLTTAYSRFLDIQLSLFSVKIINLDSAPVYINITLGSLEYSEWVFAYEIIEYELKNFTTYDIQFFYSTIATDYSVSLNGTIQSDSFTITSDTLFVITSDDIIQIDVSVAQPQPADPIIEVVANNTVIENEIAEINDRMDRQNESISVLGSFLALSLVIGFATLIFAIREPDKFKKWKERLKAEGFKLVELGDKKKDELF